MSIEHIDNTITSSYAKGVAYFAGRINAGDIPRCSSGYVSGTCKGNSQHRYAAIQFCGREYCNDCSKDGSPIHQRRVNKWFKKVESWTSVGYLVVTIPENIRCYFYDKEVLRDFRTKLLRKLKEDYKINKGLARYHWFGDCQNCSGKGCIICNYSGAGDNWYPHLNILFDSPGHIEDISTYLQPLRCWIANYFKKLLNREVQKYYHQLMIDESEEVAGVVDYILNIKNEINQESLVVNYSYVKEVAKRMNRVKYVTRSTFKIYNTSCRDLLYNFRNCVVWGWSKGEAANLESENTIDKYCPICLEKGLTHTIHWSKINKYKNNLILKKYEQTTGKNGERSRSYYAIQRTKPGDNQDPGNNPNQIYIPSRSYGRIESQLRHGNKDKWDTELYS